jgi:hypothetical protein
MDGTRSAASLHRRLVFADAWRYRLDAILARHAQRRNAWRAEFPYLAGKLAYDLLEMLRGGGPLAYPGRPYIAALRASVRLTQDPRYRGYWYDSAAHSLVGMLLGVDLNHHQGKYFFMESNLNAGLRPERRRLYGAGLDPLIQALAAVAKTQGFERIILLRRYWHEAQVVEFGRALRETGVAVQCANFATLDTSGHPVVNPVLAMPERLRPNTMYVVCTNANLTPLFHFVHDKMHAAEWLSEAIAAIGDPASRFACIPTFDRLALPPPMPDERWPNLVVKLSDADKAKAVAMGRFETEEEARRALQVDGRAGAIPGIFGMSLSQRLLHALLPGKTRVLYQPFIPPDVVDGRARKIRLLVFVSPLSDAFLSAHGSIAVKELPERITGLAQDNRPYVVNVSAHGHCCALEAEMEDELRQVALDFGRLARWAIEQKFETSA